MNFDPGRLIEAGGKKPPIAAITTPNQELETDEVTLTAFTLETLAKLIPQDRKAWLN